VLRRQADHARNLQRQQELAEERAIVELEGAAAALEERFGLTLSQARLEAGDATWDDTTTQRLKALHDRMEKLGPVNPAAEEEFEEARQRHAFLDQQQQDLQTALADIENAIRRMDRTSRELFAEMFEAVNQQFQAFFPRLFRGGKARLELTQPDNLLETGVEIIAQPPGKRLQSLTLLSGGEKALTAVALILSIFELRPTPFCILDEVDAPLDEANVVRFAEMVSAMSHTSQFIVITHNKRTMEAAHTLYGVTMEEPGVSKVVGVRLQEQQPAPADPEPQAR
jgi:chromosome segregation protein